MTTTPQDAPGYTRAELERIDYTACLQHTRDKLRYWKDLLDALHGVAADDVRAAIRIVEEREFVLAEKLAQLGGPLERKN